MLFIFCFASPYKLIIGFPLSKLNISISLCLTPYANPVPKAFDAASLAENSTVTLLDICLLFFSSLISLSVKIFSKIYPYNLNKPFLFFHL